MTRFAESHRRPLSLLLLLLVTGLLPAQNRPKVGLVLEGGGALGFAHIGVLQWFEDHHIPVDYVTGTSMGGLIGGLYATGQRPEEIRTLARDIEWDRTLGGETALQDLAFRRKEDRVDYPNRLHFGLRHGFSLPGGLNGGNEIGLILDRAVLPYFDLRSFDDLPIPFRCVATEMVSGTQAVFDHGSLASALRSTMSIPGVFSPVKSGDKIYTDGGALNNLPVDVAKDMGADLIIAVYLDPGAPDPKTFNSLVGAAARNISIMVAANEVRSLLRADIVLSADLKGFTSTDFGKSDELFPKGYEAAKRKSALLERLALNDADWKAHLAARNARRRTRVPVPEFLAIEGASPQLQPLVENSLAKEIGKPVVPAALEQELRKLNGIGYFDSIGYNIVTRGDREGLAIRATEKGYAPPFLDMGLNIDGTDTYDIRLGMSARATFMDVGGYRSELRAEGFFGPTNGLRGEYFRPLTAKSNWFVAPRAYLVNRSLEIYANQTRISQYRIGISGFGADLGYSLSRRAEIRFGQALDWQKGTLRIGIPLVPEGTTRRGISTARFRFIGVDDPIVPRSGVNAQAEYDYYTTQSTGGEGFSSAVTRLGWFRPVTENGSVFVTAAGGSSFGKKFLAGDSFFLGGPLFLGAYGKNELLGNQFYLIQGGYLHELFKLNPLLGDRVYGLGFYEVGKVYAPVFPDTPKNPMDVSAMIVVKTLIGPAFVGGSVGEGGRKRWWFGLGRVF